MNYPEDGRTAAIEHQFFYGAALLVSPVTEEGSTTAEIYLPQDKFYSLYTLEPIQGNGSCMTIKDIDTTEIPVHVRGGHILPMRLGGALATTKLRKYPFELFIAPDAQGSAKGSLYLDDGDSLVQEKVSLITFELKDGILSMDGTFDFESDLEILAAGILGWEDDGTKAKVVDLHWPLTKAAKIDVR